MNWDSLWFITSGLVGAVLLITAVLTGAFPAKEVNDFYGYRTKRSKKSQETWDFAQSHSQVLLQQIAIFNLLMAVPGLFFEASVDLSIGVSIGVMLLSLYYLYWDTEQALKGRFGE